MCSSSGSTSSEVTFESQTTDEEKINPILPRIERAQDLFARSKALWHSYLEKARTMRFTGVELSNLLHRLPALPDDLEGVSFLQGQSTWELNSSADCGLSKRTAMEQCWGLARGRPTACELLPRDDKVKNNGVAILLLGWAYILCTKLLEKQRLPMQYTSNTAVSNFKAQDSAGGNRLIIDVGDATADELRWWKAAPGQGWGTTVSEQVSYLPWSVSYQGELAFEIVTTSSSLSNRVSEQPPSSAQAALFLSKFIAMYNLDCEVSSTLAMALTLPLHNETNAILRLPVPHLIPGCSADLGNPLSHYEHLSYYMTLSSNPRFLSSALWSVFWEPGVDCNWLVHVPFLKTLQTPTPGRPIPDVAAWTGSPQSFMDLCGSGTYLQNENTISRSDVWRLRHECWEMEPDGAPFKCPPLSRWPPFGVMRADDLEIEIHRHIRCVRHRWNYARWVWHLRDKEEIIDQGYNDINESWIEPVESSQQTLCYKAGYSPNSVATKTAVAGAFRWADTQIEQDNKNIYTHRWVAANIRMPSPPESPISSLNTSISAEATQIVERWIRSVQ